MRQCHVNDRWEIVRLAISPGRRFANSRGVGTRSSGISSARGILAIGGGGLVGLDPRGARGQVPQPAATNSPVFVEVADNGWAWMRPENQNLRFVLYDKVRGQ